MKKVFLLVIGVMALSSCFVRVGNWSSEMIEPSEIIVTQTYELTAFNEVAMQGVGNMVLIQSDTIDGMVELTAPDNYIELYKIESEGGKLRIGFSKNNININARDVKIKVYAANLTSVQNSGAASVSMDTLHTDQLKVANSGVGSFRLQKVTAGEVTVRCSGVGDIAISGQCDNADLSCSGVGSIHAEDLKSQNTEARVSGVGNISCHATEYLDGKVSGVGSLRYAGNPKKVNQNKSGVGKISAI